MYLRKAACRPRISPTRYLSANTQYPTPYPTSPRTTHHSTITAITPIRINNRHRPLSTSEQTAYPTLNLRQELYSLIKQSHLNTLHLPLSKAVRIRFQQLLSAPEILYNPTQQQPANKTFKIKSRNDNSKDNPRTPIPFSSSLAQDLRSRRVVILLFVVGVFMQFCFSTKEIYKDGFSAKSSGDRSGGQLMDSRRRRAVSLGFGSAQVERFLLKRDPSGEGVTRSEEGVYREVLPYCSYGG
ncbi:hypothetical protein ETB97_008839 [Aspergillus alliaceus]|uniref:Uncharacterized protein n=1 Tax=Petromyces alliaceus TaxID=209559 RepID=A0A8H6E197_PETAA|nr:hypothetical protein ETB97_008839 [Aspergillus burnettii]